MKLIEKPLEMKKRMEEVNVRLDSTIVTDDVDTGSEQVHMNGNRKATGVYISPDVFQRGDVEQLEELLQVAINRVLEQAERLNESEMRSVAGGILPGMPGLF